MFLRTCVDHQDGFDGAKKLSMFNGGNTCIGSDVSVSVRVSSDAILCGNPEIKKRVHCSEESGEKGEKEREE